PRESRAPRCSSTGSSQTGYSSSPHAPFAYSPQPYGGAVPAGAATRRASIGPPLLGPVADAAGAHDRDHHALTRVSRAQTTPATPRTCHSRDPARTIFEQWLSRLVDAYGDRIVPITIRVAEEWGRLNVADPVPVIDGLMAATALVHDWTLVTRNAGD